MQVILNKKEKEQLVFKLYQEGKPMREIAQKVHLSFGTIGKIIRGVNGLNNDEVESNHLNNKSKETRALYLFLHGKRPVDVAIELDLPSSEVENVLQEFWVLNQLDELALVYPEIKTFLPSFLKLFHYLKEHRMLDEKNISKFLRYANYDLSDLTNRVECLSNEIINLEGQKRNLMNKVILWNAQLSDLGKAIDIKNQQLILKWMSK